MDIFIEKIVKKKMDVNDALIIGGTISLGIILSVAIIFFFRTLRYLLPVVCGNRIFGLYHNFIKKSRV